MKSLRNDRRAEVAVIGAGYTVSRTVGC